MFFIISAAFAEKKAKVITESGKKWNVLFLRMSNDTVYLKVRKPNGNLFSVSGHKSKFRRIEFLDGSTLDLDLSNFPAPETQLKSHDIGEYSRAADSTQSNPASAQPVTAESGAGNNPTDSAAAPAHYPNQKQDTGSLSATYADSSSLSGLQGTASELPKTTDISKPIANPTIKKSHVAGFSACLLSAAAFAGSAASYYLFTVDHKKSEEAYASLENVSVLGTQASELLNVNKSKHDAAKNELTISQILLGAGSALLAVGIILYF
jgi:hypothetical protein